jgi:hypothetical protein
VIGAPGTLATSSGGAVAYRWIPAFGEFEFGGDVITFKGGQTSALQESGDAAATLAPQYLPYAGIALCDQLIANGRIHGTAMFSAITRSSVCELLFGYDATTKTHLSAGLGGDGSLFSVRLWSPAGPPGGTTSAAASKWLGIETTGQRTNLRAGVRYELCVTIQGSNVTLEVDGVAVSRVTVPVTFNEARPAGLFCLGEHDITVSNYRVEAERPKAFIVMQFSSPFNEVYSTVIKNVCASLSVDAVRADEILGPGIIIKDVIDRISDSQIVIADISAPNPNVYFEVGYALALKKPIILLAQRRTASEPRLPFDLSGFRVLFYDDTIGGKPALEEGLTAHLNKILGRT